MGQSLVEFNKKANMFFFFYLFAWKWNNVWVIVI